MKKEIIEYLKSQKKSQDIVNIARHVFKKEYVTDDECNTINRILYQLVKDGILGKRKGSPPFTLSKYYLPEGTSK